MYDSEGRALKIPAARTQTVTLSTDRCRAMDVAVTEGVYIRIMLSLVSTLVGFDLPRWVGTRKSRMRLLATPGKQATHLRPVEFHIS